MDTNINTNFNPISDVNPSQQGQTQVPVQPSAQILPTVNLQPSSTQWLGTWIAPQEISSFQQSGSQQMQQAQHLVSQQSSSMSESMQFNQNEETITVLGETGVLVNKQEIVNWSGQLPINEYPINHDANPEIIRKKAESKLTYQQEICVKYLRPPTPPTPGDIIIRQEKDTVYQPAPPIVIRQQPVRPETPAPLVFREVPPKLPPFVERKLITISGKRLPPPPRKVVIERLAPLPPKPASIIVERWLAYKEQKRRVIFEKSNEQAPFFEKPRNVIIQWESPQVEIKRVVRDLGVVTADPKEYIARFGDSLKMFHEMPDFIQQLHTSSEYMLACQVEDRGESYRYQLIGDVQALQKIDLDREGLSEYKTFIRGLTSQDYQQDLSYSNQLYQDQSYPQQANSFGRSEHSLSFQTNQNQLGWLGSDLSSNKMTISQGSEVQSALGSQGLNQRRALVERCLDRIIGVTNRKHSDRITLNESRAVLAMLNSELNRNYDDEKTRRFLTGLNYGQDETILLEKFRSSMLNTI